MSHWPYSVVDIVRYFNHPLIIRQHKCVSIFPIPVHSEGDKKICIFPIGPAPKLSRTPGQLPDMVKDLHPGEHTIEVLQELGYQQKVNTFI